MDPSYLNQVDMSNQEKPKRKLPKLAIPLLVSIVIGLLVVAAILTILGNKKESPKTPTLNQDQTATSSSGVLPTDLQNLNSQMEAVEKSLLDPYTDENKLTPPQVDLKVEF